MSDTKKIVKILYQIKLILEAVKDGRIIPYDAISNLNLQIGELEGVLPPPPPKKVV